MSVESLHFDCVRGGRLGLKTRFLLRRRVRGLLIWPSFDVAFAV
jgi:hypothetical protein